MKFLATFHTHYGAIRFHKLCKADGVTSKMSPVPRELSSSCGVCVHFEADSVPVPAEHEDMEKCYAVTDSGALVPSEEM